MKALYIDESGMLTPVTLQRDGKYYTPGYNASRYRVDPTTTSQLLGWGEMDGDVIALINADAEACGDTPRAEFWIKRSDCGHTVYESVAPCVGAIIPCRVCNPR